MKYRIRIWYTTSAIPVEFENYTIGQVEEFLGNLEVDTIHALRVERTHRD